MINKENTLAKWLNDEISDSDLVAQEGSEVLKDLKKITQEVDTWSMPKYDVDAGLVKVRAKLQKEAPTNRGSKWLKLLSIMAVLGLLIYGLYWFLNAQNEVLSADPQQQMNFAFHDGSEVWINSGSHIAYKSSEWSTQRDITLEGEALFHVSKGSPFTVHTDNGSVTVLGTQFNVRAWGENLYVECYEGKVQVQQGDQTTILTANERVSVIGNAMKAKQIMDNTSPTWKNGMSRFYQDKLTIVCDELERQYAIKIDLKAGDRTFSGQFKHDDLDLALQSICKPLNLKYTISNDKNVVVIE